MSRNYPPDEDTSDSSDVADFSDSSSEDGGVALNLENPMEALAALALTPAVGDAGPSLFGGPHPPSQSEHWSNGWAVRHRAQLTKQAEIRMEKVDRYLSGQKVNTKNYSGKDLKRCLRWAKKAQELVKERREAKAARDQASDIPEVDEMRACFVDLYIDYRKDAKADGYQRRQRKLGARAAGSGPEAEKAEQQLEARERNERKHDKREKKREKKRAKKRRAQGDSSVKGKGKTTSEKLYEQFKEKLRKKNARDKALTDEEVKKQEKIRQFTEAEKRRREVDHWSPPRQPQASDDYIPLEGPRQEDSWKPPKGKRRADLWSPPKGPRRADLWDPQTGPRQGDLWSPPKGPRHNARERRADHGKSAHPRSLSLINNTAWKKEGVTDGQEVKAENTHDVTMDDDI